jgi:hypothetical protein
VYRLRRRRSARRTDDIRYRGLVSRTSSLQPATAAVKRDCAIGKCEFPSLNEYRGKPDSTRDRDGINVQHDVGRITLQQQQQQKLLTAAAGWNKTAINGACAISKSTRLIQLGCARPLGDLRQTRA